MTKTFSFLKKLIFVAIMVFATGLTASAVTELTINTKFGKPTKQELELKTYTPDSTASALYLAKTGYASYFYNDQQGFYINYEYLNRIKVLKQDGGDMANIEILYHYIDGSVRNREEVFDISAQSFNLENGKIVKTKMPANLIFKERVSPNTMLVKFTIPNVKVGSVIEYKYKIHSEVLSSLSSWYGQASIPVVYSRYEVAIPEYFAFNLEMRGHGKLITERKPGIVNFTIGGNLGGASQPLTVRTTELSFEGNNMEAVKADDYTWCPSDYRAHVDFEMSGYQFPGSLYKSFSSSWNDVDDMVINDSSFGGLLNMKNPFSNEMASLKLETLPSIEDKVSAIFNLLNKKMKWNDKYKLWSDDIKKDISAGTGSNASINFVLMSMLRDAGISCTPTLLRTCDEGVLPLTHPSLSSFNTFVVRFIGSNNTPEYIDASCINGYINILPNILNVNRARILDKNINESSRWANLTKLSKNMANYQLIASLDENGLIKGTRSAILMGQHALACRKSYNSSSEAKFKSNIENALNVRINNLAIKNIDKFAPDVTMKMDFEGDATVNDSIIYINPMIIPDKSENKFVQVDRKLPIEMSYPEECIINTTIAIPKGYIVEEMPKSQTFTLPNNAAKCIYSVSANSDNNITAQYRFILSKTLFAPEEYKLLKDFWSILVEKNNGMVVLKKAANTASVSNTAQL